MEIQTDGPTTQKQQILTSGKAMKLIVSQTSSAIEKKLEEVLKNHGRKIIPHLSSPTGAAPGKVLVMIPVLLMHLESYRRILKIIYAKKLDLKCLYGQCINSHSEAGS